MPIVEDRLTAGWLIEKQLGEDPIPLSGSIEGVKQVKKQLDNGLAVVGANVCSLFPPLRNVDPARLAKKSSKVEFVDVDYFKALRYISLVGGDRLLDRNNLLRSKPIWKGKLTDLLTVGGDSARDDSNWRDSRKNMFESEKRTIMAVVVEILVNVMGSHVYTFNGDFFLQVAGGPIGLRSTACLASLIMKLWDRAWLALMDREGISLYDLFMYVDDVRSFLRPLCHGIRWNGENFVHSSEAELEDLQSQPRAN